METNFMEAPDKIYLPEEPFKDGNSETCWNYKPIGGIEYIRTDVAIEKIEEFKSVLVEEIERRRKGWSYGSSIEAKYKREECDDILSWLEKQSNQKVTLDFKAKAWYVSKVDNKIYNIYGSGKSALEAIEEEKVDNANKVEPRFKESDWITNGENTIQIITVDTKSGHSGYYRCFEGSHGFGWYVIDIESANKNYHLWSLKDAKNGDVLYSPKYNVLWIYMDKEQYHAAINLNYAKFVSFNAIIVIPSDVCPATKEQYEILFQKIKEAGYEWNTYKKMLEKHV